MRISAIICAAGQGKRMGLGHNKQFLELHDKPLLVHTLQRWQEFRMLEQLVLVVGEGDVQQVKHLIHEYKLTGVSEIVIGGKERQDSVYQGLLALKKRQPEAVLIHDGARPFVQEEQLELLVKILKTEQAAVLAVPVKDTIKRVDQQGKILETLPRPELWAIQTPQAFHYPLVLEAHEHAQKQGILATDDAALIERLGLTVKVVQGHEHNIKLTTPEDLGLAQWILQEQSSAKE